jgi:hypothetical protein
MSLVRFILLAFAFAACSAEREAVDPHSLIEGGSYYDRPPDAESESGKPKYVPTTPAGAEPAATRAQCKKAAENMVRLGIEQGIEAESDPEKRKQLEADRASALQSDGARQMVEQFTDACMKDGMDQKAAQCVAQVKKESEIESCY